jgi:hypothetical protein
MSLTPEIIQERSINGEISKNLALEQLTILIENSENDSLRLKSLNALQELNYRSENLYNLLEHLLISDENEEIRSLAGKILILSFSEKELKPIMWALENESSYSCLSSLFESIREAENFNYHKVLLTFLMNILHRLMRKRNLNF